jgi:hypothetical protein
MTAITSPSKSQQDQTLVNSELTEKRSRGRPKGTVAKNHQFLLNRLQDMYGKDWNPILKAAEMATRMHLMAEQSEDMADMKASVDAWDKVAQYIAPKLKAVEIQASDKAARQINSVTINVVGADKTDVIEQSPKSLIKDIN